MAVSALKSKASVRRFFDWMEEFQTDQNVYACGDVCVRMRPSKAGDCVYIMNIVSSDRGKGLASEVLKNICNIADLYCVDLFLEIDPSDGSSNGLSNEELFNWFWRFGFIGSKDEMIRRWDR